MERMYERIEKISNGKMLEQTQLEVIRAVARVLFHA